uniref:ORF44k n=1 Tax=Pinus koraiensis TaxID=88728 RepID=A4QMA6_PINKO|nr:ORF44k [Pinus koraiensis]ABP35443.1 ORF44k [Pinus koraiensis]
MFPTKKEGSGVHFSSYDPHLLKMKTLFRGTKTICHDRFQAKHLL